MGIIKRQAIQGTIFSYMGVAVGFITTLLIYPKVFSKEQIGLIRILVAYSALFAQFATLGFPRVTTMMFTYFRDYQKKHHGFFHIAMLVSLTGLILSLIIFFALQPYIVGRGEETSGLFAEYAYYIVPLIISNLLFILFDTYYKVLFNSVQGTFLKEFLQRLLILTITVLFLFHLINFEEFIILFVASFTTPPLLMMILLLKDKELSLKPEYSFIDRSLGKKMINVSFFGILTSFSGILVLNIDSIMINEYLNLGETGIYSITFFFGTVVLLPSRPLLKISSVVIADAWKNNNIRTIDEIYYKSCLNQVIIGGLFFIGIWGNIHNVFNNFLLPPDFEPGKYVIFFISLASLIQLAGGTSNMILFTSKNYKVHTFLMLILVICLILSNMILIPVYGIVGAAIASAASFLIFNLIKFLYLNLKFGFKPYDYKILFVLVIAGFVYFSTLFLPKLDSFILDIIYRSIIITIIYSVLILVFRLSKDINASFDSLIKKIFNSE